MKRFLKVVLSSLVLIQIISGTVISKEKGINVTGHNKIVSMPLSPFSNNQIQIFDENGNMTKCFDDIYSNSIIYEDSDIILFQEHLGFGYDIINLLDINKEKIISLTDAKCIKYYINNKNIFLQVYASDTVTKNYQIFDLNGNKQFETNDINDTSIKNIPLKKLELTGKQMENNIEVINNQNGGMFNLDTSYNINDLTNNKIYNNVKYINTWTADNDNIYYITRPNETNMYMYSELNILNRNTGEKITKEIPIVECEDIQLYKNKIIFNGYLPISCLKEGKVPDCNVFIMDKDGNNLHPFKNNSKIVLSM